MCIYVYSSLFTLVSCFVFLSAFIFCYPCKSFTLTGGPYRREILGTPLNSRRKAVTWTGEFDVSSSYIHKIFSITETKLLLNHQQGKPSQEEKTGFYPAPTKMILPNPKLRDWNVTLSERTSNMLKNLERSLWVTSYQMHYTGEETRCLKEYVITALICYNQ